jgi:manganese-dependent inorganic pyrophosphatase
VLDEVAEANNFALVALYVTDIIKNGSYVIFNSRGSNIMDIAYQTNVNQGYFIKGCLSRKKHVIPLIMEVIE